MVKDIAIQAYTLQNTSIEGDRYVGAPELVTAAEERRAVLILYNRRHMQTTRSLTEEQYLARWQGAK